MDDGILTAVLNEIYTACGASGDILNNAKSLFIPLMTIDFVVVFIMQVFGFANSNYIPTVFSKLMKYGFWIWVVDNWAMLTTALIQSLTTVGSSFGSLDPGILKNPSKIIDKGFAYSAKYYDVMSEISLVPGNGLVKNLFIWIICVVAMLGIFAAFAYIALNALITYIEFYVVAAVLLIFLPFAVFDKTSRFSENAIGFIMGTGVKLMMMGAILSLCINISDSHLNTVPDLTGDNAWAKALTSLVVAWVFTFLSVHVPELASGAMSGSPSLSGNTATASMAGAMSGGIAGAVASKAMGAAGGGANIVAKAAGAFGEGSGGNFGNAAKQGMAALSALGIGDTKTAADLGKEAIKSAGKGAAGSAKSLGKGMFNSATSNLQDSYDKGQGAAQAKFGQYHPTSPGTGSQQEKARTSGEQAKDAATKDQTT